MNTWEETLKFDLDELDSLPNMGDINQDVKVMLKAQAEISFKAGEVEGFRRGLEMQEPYREGIREVVGWIMNNIEVLAVGQDLQDHAANVIKYGQHSHIYIRWLDWQAKLKEWGIDETVKRRAD